MPEDKKRMETYEVDYRCDDCGRGVKWDGMVLTSYPAQYDHNCPGCGKRYRFQKSYPCIEHEYSE